MKKIEILKTKIVTVFFLALLVFTSCEKVVVINVKSADNRVVVQGNLSNQPGPYAIKLDYSVKYYADNTFPTVSGAEVVISDSEGNSETLKETLPGIYQTIALQGVTGRTYYLNIKTNSKTYTAVDKMPDVVQIDSFLVVPILGRNSLVPNGYRVTCKFTDPEGLGNYYKVLISSRDTAAIGDRNMRVVSDKLTDGQQMAVTFRTTLILQDTVTLSLQGISKSTFDFYTTLSNAEGAVGASQFLSSLPANPTNNIKTDGLGYFSAYSEVIQTKVAQ